jgi:hypothetical protein
MRFFLLDLRLYLTEVHSIIKFAVQVTVYCDFKNYHSILYDLQRNYDNIAQSGNIQIITARDNQIILVHKDVQMLRSPVFKALFDRLHYLRSWHMIHHLPYMHGQVIWYITYHLIRHLPSIHIFIYHVCFLLLLFYSGKTSYYRLQVRLRLRVGYLFLSEARNK